MRNKPQGFGRRDQGGCLNVVRVTDSSVLPGVTLTRRGDSNSEVGFEVSGERSMNMGVGMGHVPIEAPHWNVGTSHDLELVDGWIDTNESTDQGASCG